jgi:hypothetical protein
MNLFRKQLTGYHIAPITMVNGRGIDGAKTAFTFYSSVQTPKPFDLQFLTIGRRESKSYVLYTNTKLQALQAGTTNPDQIVINGETFEVDYEAPWQNTSLSLVNHYKYIIVLMGAIE